MTVDDTLNVTSAPATGVAGETVTVPYLFFKNKDLVVYVEDQVTKAITTLALDTDYTVTGAGVSTGGKVTMITTQTAGDKIVVARWLEAKQEASFPETGKFPAKSVETTVDRMTMILQQVLGRMGGQSFSPGFTQFMSRLATDQTKWDAGTSIISDVKDPKANQDAATKGFVVGLISGSGSLPAPDDPADDEKGLRANAGAVTYQDAFVTYPAVGNADVERALEATGVGEGAWAWRDIGRRNHLINGGFTVAQRGGLAAAPFTAATTHSNSDDTVLLDRWVLLSNGNDIVDVSQDLTAANMPTGAYASLKSLVATANAKWGYLQILEARDAAALIGGTVSLSFDVVGSGISNVRAVVLAWDGTVDVVTSDVVSVWGAAGTNPTFATNWTPENVAANLAVTGSVVRKKIEGILVNTSGAKNVAIFIWVDDTDAAVSDTLNISNVTLERSATAHAFVPRIFQEELALCQRYYAKTFSQNTAPAQNTGNNGILVEMGASNNNGHFTIGWQYPQVMFKAPTITTYNPGAANADARNLDDSTDTPVTVSGIGGSGCHIEDTAPDTTDATNKMGIHLTADAEL